MAKKTAKKKATKGMGAAAGKSKQKNVQYKRNSSNTNSNNKKKTATKKKKTAVKKAVKKKAPAKKKAAKKKAVSKPAAAKKKQAANGSPLPPGVVRTQSEVAKAFSVTTRTVENWVKDLMPRMDNGMYHLVEIAAWHYAKISEKKSQPRPAEEWEAAYRKYKALQAELDYKHRQGELLELAEVESGRIERILALKRSLLLIPKQLSPRMEGMTVREMEAFLTQNVKSLIDQFATQPEGEPSDDTDT